MRVLRRNPPDLGVAFLFRHLPNIMKFEMLEVWFYVFHSCLFLSAGGCLNGSVRTMKTNGNRTKVQDVGYGWAGRLLASGLRPEVARKAQPKVYPGNRKINEFALKRRAIDLGGGSQGCRASVEVGKRTWEVTPLNLPFESTTIRAAISIR